MIIILSIRKNMAHYPKVILELIENRLRFFLELKIYLSKIRANQIEAEELIQFLRDVVGINITAVHKEKENLIELIVDKVELQFRSYRELKQCFNIEDKRLSLNVFKLLLDLNLSFSRISASQLKDKEKKLTLDSKVALAFSDYDFFKELTTIFKQLIPSEMIRLDKLICIKEPALKQQKTGTLLEGTIDVHFGVKWKPFKLALVNRVQRLQQYTQQGHTNFTLEEAAPFFEKFGRLVEQTAENEIFKAQESNFDLLKRQASLFFDYEEIFNSIDLLEKEMKTTAEKIKINDKINQQYQKEQRQFTTITDHLKTKIAEVAALFKDKFKQSDRPFAEFKLMLDALQEDISHYSQSSALSDSQNSLEELLNSSAQLKSQGVTLEAQIATLKQIFHETSLAQEAQALAQEASLAQLKAEEEKIKIADFFKERQVKLQAYKLQIEMSRQSKLEQSKQAQEAMPSRDEAKDESSSSHSTVNQEIEYFLKKLHEDDVQMIQAIFELKRGLTYKTAKNLIINKLGGSISEIGNGSSHKRIRLNHLYSEFYTHAETEEPSLLDGSSASASVATGGMFKPHGRAHNPGELSFFNIKLLRTVLERANITPANVEKARLDLQGEVGAGLR